MTQKLTELFKPHARQRAFLEAVATHQYTLYGGAGGGGKSYILRWTLVCLLLEWASKRNLRNVRVGLFSKDYTTLKDRQISKIAAEMPDWLGMVRDTKEDGLGFYLHERYGGGGVLLRNLDDPAKYKSVEFAAVAVEELTENEEQTFHDLRFRMRWPGIPDTKFMGATNPGGIGHTWVKRFWIEHQFPPEMQDTAKEFAYVPAKFKDNPHGESAYGKILDSLPPMMRAAVRDGSWDVFSGQKFSEWRREVHVVKPFAIPSWWERWGANDPGYGDPATWYWLAADQDGNVYIYREATYERISHSEQARKVVTLSREEKMAYWVTGMDAFVKDPNTGKSYIDYYAQGGLLGFRRPDHGPGARRRRAATWHEYLRTFADPRYDPAKDNGVLPETARVKIFDEGQIGGSVFGCPKLIETLPALAADENDREAVAMCAADHWYDGSGYGLQSRHAHAEVPAVPEYADGTLGDLLGHASVLEHNDDEEKKPRRARR